MIHIHFILNPIAGKGNNELDLALLNKHFDKEFYHYIIKPTCYKKHAIALTQESLAQKADIIVACGGDGTINEVASCLVNSTIPLGIIPIGSGNGLASNLNIPKNIDKALELIKIKHTRLIDVGRLNHNYFFSNTGIGFDAQVIKHYEASNERTISSYIKATVISLKKVNNKIADVETTINDKTMQHKPFLIFISNTNEMGYNVSLTPKALLDDGKLDVLIVPKLSFFKIVLFTLLMLIKRHNILKEVQIFQTKNIKISNKKTIFQIQIDGEFSIIKNRNIDISILERALTVICLATI